MHHDIICDCECTIVHYIHGKTTNNLDLSLKVPIEHWKFSTPSLKREEGWIVFFPLPNAKILGQCLNSAGLPSKKCNLTKPDDIK